MGSVGSARNHRAVICVVLRVQPSCATLLVSLFGLGVSVVASRPVAAQVSDSAFVAMEGLGAHQFVDLPDGGTIELRRDPSDTSGVRRVREHLTSIAAAFSAGDFRIPGLVHAGKEVAGVETMKARRQSIAYRYHSLPGGGEVRISTRDSVALRAIHAYLEFQRTEHRTAEHH